MKIIFICVVSLFALHEFANAQTMQSSDSSNSSSSSNSSNSSDRDFEQIIETSGEWLFSDDFQIGQWAFQYGHDYEKTEWDLGLIYNHYELDLTSPDPFFEAISTSANRILAQANITRSLNPKLTWQGIAGYYEGFQNYRALWIHEYYHQIGSLPFFEEYPEISPRGYQIGTQFRFEYLPSSAYLEATFGYYKDWIAPSAEFERETLLGRSVIDSFSYRLASENILSPRLRSLFEFQLTHTAARQRRYGVQQSINFAISERWVLRSIGGWVSENPGFESYFFGTTAEIGFGENWLLSGFARYYHDTGEIQNSLPATNAPPGLESIFVGLGLRWIGIKSSAGLTIGPYFTRYEKTNIEAPFFEDLYQSRDWMMLQLAYALRF